VTDDARLASDKVIANRYRLQQRIGFGGMGAVYYGHDLLIDRPVAVKELRREYARDDLIRRRFVREARAAGGLSHPHIVTVYDLVEQDDTLFIVMEYLDGGTLLDRMAEGSGGRIDVAFGLEVARQALLGLEAAHDAGLVHRDIKPGNLLFDHRGVVKIADFGVVRARDDDMTALTSTGGHPGTLVYMAPEQIDGAEVEGRSDVYALAAVLYEALAGVRYFERHGLKRSERALMDAICDAPPIALREHVPYVAKDVEAVIMRALAKALDDRPRAREMAAEIARIQQTPKAPPEIVVPGGEGGAQAEPPAKPESDPYAETRPSTRHRREAPPIPPAEPREDLVDEQPTQPRQRPPTQPVLVLEVLGQEPPTPAPTTGRRVEPARPENTERRERDGASVIRIPAGAFTMGGEDASDQMPIRTVRLDAFTIDRAPVTVGRYRQFLEAIAREGPPVVPLIRRLFKGGKDHRPTGWDTDEFRELCRTDDHPVVLVDWFDACAYAKWVGARLPTEAEWERAARGGGDARLHPWGDEPVDDSRAVFGRQTYGPEPVGSRPLGASPDGVLDVVGNVWEWCADRYHPDAYRTLPDDNPSLGVTTEATVRGVKRGASWTNAWHSIRVTKRGFEHLTARRDNLGFRCAGG